METTRSHDRRCARCSRTIPAGELHREHEGKPEHLRCDPSAPRVLALVETLAQHDGRVLVPGVREEGE